MTTTFFAPPDCIADGRIVLPDDEARHAVRALRHAVGDEIEVVDGAGGWYRVRLTEAGKSSAAGEVVATEREVGEPAHRLTVGLSTLKNAGRFETFAEKAVELGVTEILPLVTERTERARLKPKRLGSMLVAALKQSGRSRLPGLAEPQPLAAVLSGRTEGLRILCHEAAGPDALLPRVLDRNPAGETTILVGPEGGFSEAEVAEAQAAGWAVASLGPRRLRAETAALAAASAAMLHLSHQVRNDMASYY
ncbi:MAG: RsmE family RNA methyltransferase [Bacteroidota bacterium]